MSAASDLVSIPTPAAGPDLSVRLGDLVLANPIGTASGTYGKGLEFRSFYDVSALGFVVVKTITKDPRPGNVPPRLVETAGGLLNSIGLPNPGIEAYCAEVLPKLRTLGAPVVINIAGHDAAGFAELAARLEREEGIAALELNMSCPNVAGGLDFSATPEAARDVLRRVRDVTDRPLVAKLSPNVTDVRPIAVAAAEAGATAVSAVNTLLGLAVDWRRRRPVLGRGVGGLSGPAIKPIALRIVRELWKVLDVPIVGIGGIQDADDVMEFLLAGATAVQLGTVNYYRPDACHAALKGLPARLRALGASSVREIVGTLEEPAGTA
jgi:dihydroorotate dehydrogenase (NAD+) catalytic subunit